jgi:two-component sensor histidine kinase
LNRPWLITFFLAIGYLLIAGSVNAQPCSFPQRLKADYQKLIGFIESHEPIPAIKLIDSLSNQINEQNLQECPTALWVQFYYGEALEMLGKKTDALGHYYQLVPVAESLEQWEIAAEIYISMARTHETLRRDDDCLRNLRKAQKLITQYDLPGTYSRLAIRLSSYHRFFDSLDSARYFAQEAIQYGKEYGVLRSELDGQLLMGILTDSLDASIRHFQAAVQIYLDRKAYFGAVGQTTNIITRLIQADEIDRAIPYLDSAEVYAQKITDDYVGFHRSYQTIYNIKRVLFEREGEIDSAYLYLQKSIDAEVKADIQVNQKEINEKESAFALEQEKAKLASEQQRARFLRWGLLFLIGLLAFMLFAYLNNLKKKRQIARQKDLLAQNNAELNESNQQQLLLLSEVHHRVKNNLQLVISLLDLKGKKIEDPEVRTALDELSSKVQSIALIHDQLYRTGEFETIQLGTYLMDLASHFQLLDQKDQSFNLEIHAQDINLNLETVLPIGITCAELFNNSLKYGRQPGVPLLIIVKVKRIAQGYQFYYADNGPGYPEGQLTSHASSLGGLLIQSMTRQLRAESRTFNDQGAVFVMQFQEKEVSKV